MNYLAGECQDSKHSIYLHLDYPSLKLFLMCLDHCVFQSNGLFSFLDKFTAIHSLIISFCHLFKICGICNDGPLFNLDSDNLFFSLIFTQSIWLEIYNLFNVQKDQFLIFFTLYKLLLTMYIFSTLSTLHCSLCLFFLFQHFETEAQFTL